MAHSTSLRVIAVILFAGGLAAEEAPNYFSLGVQSYLRQDYEAAAGQLKSAIERDQDKEKAQKLLLKVLLEGSKHYQSRGEGSKAEVWAKKAAELFPGIPETLDASRPLKPKEISKPKPRVEKKIEKSKPAEKPVPISHPPAADPGLARRGGDEERLPILTIAMAGYGALMAAFALILWYMRRKMHIEIRKNKEEMTGQINALKKALHYEESEKNSLMRELESRKDMLRLIESALKKESSPAPLPPVITQKAIQPLPSPSIPIVHVQEVVKEEEQRRQAAQEKLKALKNIRPTRAQAQFQKKQILETLIKITPDEREESQRRIAAQAMNLYEAFPKEAVTFLKDLVRDADPMVRLNMIPALVQIPAEEALWMLISLLSDSHPEVKREALKALKNLKDGKIPGVPVDGKKEIIEKALAAEVAKLEWVI